MLTAGRSRWAIPSVAPACASPPRSFTRGRNDSPDPDPQPPPQGAARTRPPAGPRMILRRKQAQGLISLALLLVASCRTQNGAPATNNSTADTFTSATPPFQTKEPERYRAIRSITTTTTDGRTRTVRYAIARDGDSRRFEAEFLSVRMIFVQGPDGKFVLVPDKKVYMDQTQGVPLQPYEDESSPERLLHTESGTSSYKQLGSEVI